jgi:hypothetical protein
MNIKWLWAAIVASVVSVVAGCSPANGVDSSGAPASSPLAGNAGENVVSKGSSRGGYASEVPGDDCPIWICPSGS